MLYTNLKHLNCLQEYQAAIKKDENVLICCGRMDTGSIMVYRIMETLEKHYPTVRFYDIEFDNPESLAIRDLAENTAIADIPLLTYYKNGKLIALSSGQQTKEQIVTVLEKEFN
jgi:thioredoxin 1